MFTRLSSRHVALVVLSLILFGLFPSSPPTPGSAAPLQPEPATPPAAAVAHATAGGTVYMPLLLNAIRPPQLLNGGFEGGTWRKTFTGEVFVELAVPEHWVAFWDRGRKRPEMAPIPFKDQYVNPPRVHSGAQALKYFSYWAVSDAGVFQQVASVPGINYRARAYAHAWYNDLSGDELEFRASKSQWRDATGTVHDIVDGDPGLEVMIGIDPTGGTNPWASTVIWSKANIYDQFKPIEVQARAQAALVTVYLRSENLYAFRHCDTYWDEVTLEIVR
jgi:hypothetical protein